MSIGYGTRTVIDNSVLHIDAANAKSWDGSLIKDLSNPALSLGSTSGALVVEDGAFNFTDSYAGGISVNNENYNSQLYDFTMECLCSPSGTHSHYDGALLSSGNWNNTHWSFSLLQNNLGIRTRNPSFTYDYSFVVGNWYHIVYVRRGTTCYFIVNGEKSQEFTQTSFIPLSSGASNTTVGRETYASGYFNFNGKIALAKIYDKALSDNQIAQNFEAYRGRYEL